MINPFREQKLALMEAALANGQVDECEINRLSLLSQMFEELICFGQTDMSHNSFLRMQETNIEIYNRMISVL